MVSATQNQPTLHLNLISGLPRCTSINEFLDKMLFLYHKVSHLAEKVKRRSCSLNSGVRS
jgi:hypothetical protein